jgi:16S rRNA processing protein RimM
MPDRDDRLVCDRICVGAIAGAFGVSGEARIKSFCAEPDAIAGYGPLTTEDGTRSFTLRLTRAVKGGFAARLSGVATREAAEALKGTRLYAPRERLPALAQDEFYHADLIGLTVLDTGGAEIGRVRAIHDHGAGDMLEVTRPGGGMVLIPFTGAAVPTVDLARGRIVADPPEGTLDRTQGRMQGRMQNGEEPNA